jgi:hypothetical protein
MNVIKTAMAVRLLGTTYHRLFGLVRYGKIPARKKTAVAIMFGVAGT